MASIASSVNATIEDPRQQQKQTNPLFRFICNTDNDKVGKINQHYDNEIKKIRDKIYDVEERFSLGNENPEAKMTTNQVNANKQMIDKMIKNVDRELVGLLKDTHKLILRSTPGKGGKLSPILEKSNKCNNVPGLKELKKIKNALKLIRNRLYSLFLLVDGSKKAQQKMNPALQRVKKTKYGGRKKKTRKVNKLSLSDYRKILKFYKMKIPNSASKIRKEGNKIIAKKFCSCIKKVRKKFKKEGIAIGICTKSVITRKNIKRGQFECKKRRTIKLYKGGSKKSKKNQSGGVDPQNNNNEEAENAQFSIGSQVTIDPPHQEYPPDAIFIVKASRRLQGGIIFYTLAYVDDESKILLRQEGNLVEMQGGNKDKNGGHPRPLISHPHDDEEYEGGKKSKKIKDIIKIFKQYPDIFPRGYFRYLPATLEKHDKKGTLIYKNGVVLTYTKYKKTVNKYKKYKIKPGDVKLNQLVNKNQGNGKAKKIFLKFMEKHKDSNLLLDVLASNKKAIKFYRKNGFKKIDDTKFGDKLKGIVMLKRSKKNKTRKKKN